MDNTANGSRSSTPGAAHVIAGFRYQLLQSLAALISLADTESLLLEITEDFSVATDGTSVDYQVKNSQALAGPPALSLQSRQIRDCLARFWGSDGDTVTMRRLVFMARGGAAKERGIDFPDGQPGLKYWRAAAIDGDTNPIRTALRVVFAGQPIGVWLEGDPDDDELRDRLLRRVVLRLDASDRRADQADVDICRLGAIKFLLLPCGSPRPACIAALSLFCGCRIGGARHCGGRGRGGATAGSSALRVKMRRP